MKKFIIFAILIVGFIFSGCVNKTSVAKSDAQKYNPSMTSQQVEEVMGWKYCEEVK